MPARLLLQLTKRCPSEGRTRRQPPAGSTIQFAVPSPELSRTSPELSRKSWASRSRRLAFARSPPRLSLRIGRCLRRCFVLRCAGVLDVIWRVAEGHVGELAIERARRPPAPWRHRTAAGGCPGARGRPGICDRILGRLGNPSSASSDPASPSASASNRSSSVASKPIRSRSKLSSRSQASSS
jgi:hypothetical protein